MKKASDILIFRDGGGPGGPGGGPGGPAWENLRLGSVPRVSPEIQGAQPWDHSQWIRLDKSVCQMRFSCL